MDIKRLKPLIRELGKRAVHALAVTVMTTPPWNIACWGIAATVYFAKGYGKNPNEKAIKLLLFAPVSVPILFLLAVKSGVENMEQLWQEGRLRQISQEIESVLRCAGIRVVEVNHGLGVGIEAEVRTDQIAAYRRVYAEAIRRHMFVDPVVICAFARPLFPLDREWAKKYNMRSFAEECRSSPCVLCQTVDDVGWQFGKDVAANWLKYSARFLNVVVHHGGREEEIRGYVCKACQAMFAKVRTGILPEAEESEDEGKVA